MLHNFNDGSVLKKVKVRELLGIPVWRGNRHIDEQHARQIKHDIGDNISCLDTSVFRAVRYKENNKEQRFLIDGQHRQYALRAYFEENIMIPDFDVLLIEKEVDSESDVIEYFNMINNVKPQYENDPRLLGNKYILALEGAFNVNRRNPLIRPEGKATKRPYLSSDAVRNEIEKYGHMLKQSPAFVAKFISEVREWNKKALAECELRSIYASPKDHSILDNCLEKKFILAFDSKLPWIRECLTRAYLL